MPFKDLREFIAKLEQEGEVQRIEEEVDWNLEVGAMVRRADEAGLPAPFFQKIKDYPGEYRIFAGMLANYKRMAMAMDMDPETPGKELVEAYVRRTQKPIKPVLVNHGPCKENVLLGDEIDLYKFPVPMIHPGDGGRYIATMHVNVAKDYNSDWVNWGMYRGMVCDKNTISTNAHPWVHMSKISKGWGASNKPTPVAIAIGTEPVSTFCAAAPLPFGVTEVDIAGGVRGEPVELIKCETSNLEVPATSEIVIEGEIRPNDELDEGPFGEFMGYRTAGKKLRPAIRVKAITYRNKPILTMTCMGGPIDDAHIIIGVTRGADCLQALRARGLPVTGVCVPAEASGVVAVVAIKPPHANVADDIAHVIWSTESGHVLPYIIIVDDDVDPYNMNDVMHAVFTKCHPYRGIARLEHCHITPLHPCLNSHERKYGMGAKAYFDCTSPLDWDPEERPKRVSFKQFYSFEIQQKCLDKWAKYGY